MAATTLIADLQRRGLRLRAEGDALIVTPKRALTDQLRKLIRTHKPEILRALAPLPSELERRISTMAAGSTAMTS